MTQDDLREAATQYAREGYHVIPLYGITGGLCDCRTACKSPGKHPIGRLVPNGLSEATSDPAIIERWWEKEPNANIGVRTGRASNLYVIDADAKRSVDIGHGVLIPEGTHSLREWGEMHEPLPSTSIVDTGGGGEHWWYTYPDTGDIVSSTTNILPSVDIRAEGGYVVAPPSKHAQGTSYRWRQGQEHPAQPPMELVAHTASKKQHEPINIDDDAAVSEGGRHDYLLKVGGYLRGQYGLGLIDIYGSLLARNANHCDPPMDPEEVRTIAESCARFAPPSPEPEIIFASDDEVVRPPPPIPDGADVAISLQDFMAHPPQEPAPLVTGVFGVGEGIIWGGQPNVGKTWIALDLALAVATGTPFLHHFEVPQSHPVLMIDEEGSQWNNYRRFEMMLEGRRVGSTIDIPIHVSIGRGVRLDTPQGITIMQRMLERYRPKLVIMDSLVRMHGGDENSSRSMADFFHLTKQIMTTYETSILFTHHVRKPSLESNDPGDLIRGSTDIRGWPDVIHVFQATEDSTEITAHTVKQRNRARMDPFSIRVLISNEDSEATLAYIGDAERSRRDDISASDIRQAIASLPDPTLQNIASYLDRHPDTLRKGVMQKMRDARMIGITGVGFGKERRMIYTIQ